MGQKSCGTSPKRECWKTEEPCPEKTETYSGNTKPRTRKTFSAWLREDVEGKEEEREKMKQGSQKKKRVKVGTERWRERERVEINSKRICLESLSSPDVCGRVYEAVRPSSEVESVGNSWDFSACAIPLSVVWFCEAVLSDSDCETVEPQTFLRSRKREASVALFLMDRPLKLSQNLS